MTIALIALALVGLAWGTWRYDDDPGLATLLLCAATVLAVATMLTAPSLNP